MKNKMMMNKAWEILEIAPTDSKRDIRRAYSACLKKYHPEEEPEKFQMVKDAYELVMENLRNQHKDASIDFENTWETVEEDTNVYEEEKEEVEKDSDPSLLGELSRIMEQTVYQDPLSEKIMQKVIALFENPDTREEEKAWADFFLEWEFLDVQLKTGFAESLTEFLKAQQCIPDGILIELMNAYDLEVAYDYLVTLDVTERGEIKPLLKGAQRMIASLWNEQEEEKRVYLWEEHLNRQKNLCRRGDFHEYFKIRYLFESGLLIEGQEKLWENALWHGNPEHIVAWKEEEDLGYSIEVKEDYRAILYAYLVKRFEIPEFICSYFYREYELYFLDGCKWEKWYIPLRDEVLKRYPQLQEKQFRLLGQEFGGQNLAIEEQKSLMAMVSPFTRKETEGQEDAYQQIIKLLQEKQRKGDYSYHFYLFSYCINRMKKNKISEAGFDYVIKIVVYLKSYLFALPHMEYPEEVRSCFFETLWGLTYYFENNRRKKKFEFNGEDEFLLHCESSRLPAVFSVWDLDSMPYGICSHCGKELEEISFEAGKKKQGKREIVEEWDLYEVAKGLAKKTKKNFGIYKKVSKLYQYRTCEHCGEEETFIDAYMNWWYENTQWKRPNKELLEWIFQKAQGIEKNYEGNSQREQYYKFIIDYLHESKDWDKKRVVDYFRQMQTSYKFEEEKKERVYYLEKTRDMLEQVLAQEELTREERERFTILKADIICDGIGNRSLTFEEAEKEWDFVIELYDSLCGVGNMKSIQANEKKAFSLAYNHNQKYDPERAITILERQLELLQKNYPEETKKISDIQESMACIYRDKLKDYDLAATYYEQYLKYVEDTYGKEDEYSRGERRIFEEICKMAEK